MLANCRISKWKDFSPSEVAIFRRQYIDQSSQIYRQFTGSDNPAKYVYIAVFHLLDGAGSFVIAAFTVPAQSDLVALLKSQARDKADYGIREGYIRKFLGLVPIDTHEFSGFYIKMIGKDGEVVVSGGLEHKRLKNTIIQLSLFCPSAWDEGKATNTLSALIESVKLKGK